MAMNNWMSEIDGLRQLNSIVLPGSHDAGMVKELSNRGGLATIANAVTQLLPVKKQLEAGVRWLDIRINKQLRCFHSAAEGETLDSVADGIISFLDENSSEVVIVLLTKSDESAYPAFLRKLHGLCALHPAPVYPNGHNNQVALVSLNSLRNRVVVVMDEPPPNLQLNHRIVRALLKKYDAKDSFQEKNLMLFDADKADGQYNFVLNTAGSYSDANNTTSIQEGQRTRLQNLKEANTNLFMAVYYATNTSPIGLRWSSIEAADEATWHQAELNKWGKDAFGSSRQGGRPLISCVMMDFVSEERCLYLRKMATQNGW